MFKNKTTIITLAILSFLVLIAPFMVQAMDSLSAASSSRSYYSCSHIPHSFCAPANKGCYGDVWWHVRCQMYCKTGNTATPAIGCDWVTATALKKSVN
ncbi:MAG: hypothetical protein GY765_28305 [bacterium]|nr:hypothetical protein [bacterium]